jgi:hypothetical protein
VWPLYFESGHFFTYQQEVKSKHLEQHKPDRIHTINNSSYQKARIRAKLQHVRCMTFATLTLSACATLA